MSSTRSIVSTPPFASNALTVIPPTPVAGVPYRDPAAGPASSPDGWPYGERVNSAEFNQIMFQSTSLLSIMDKKGVLGWSDLVNYTEAAICFASDGLLYSWIQASGPGNGGAKDPAGGANPTFWERFSPGGRVLNIRMITTTQTYVPTPGTKFVYGILISGGGAGGGAQSTATGNNAAGLGGSAGGRLDFYVPVSAIANLTLTIGSAGVGVANAAGGAGGATTLGTMTVPGGTSGGVGVNAAPPWLLGESGNSLNPTGGNISNIPGQSGGMSFSLVVATMVSGRGGSSFLGTGGNSRGNVRGNGSSGTGIGAGGGGAVETSAGPGGLAGGNGTGGGALFWEMS